MKKKQHVAALVAAVTALAIGGTAYAESHTARPTAWPVKVPGVANTYVTPTIRSDTGTVGVFGSVLGTPFQFRLLTHPETTSGVLFVAGDALSLVVGTTNVVLRPLQWMLEGTSVDPSVQVTGSDTTTVSATFGTVGGTDVGFVLGPIPAPNPIGPGSMPDRLRNSTALAPSVTVHASSQPTVSAHAGTVAGTDVGFGVGFDVVPVKPPVIAPPRSGVS